MIVVGHRKDKSNENSCFNMINRLDVLTDSIIIVFITHISFQTVINVG